MKSKFLFTIGLFLGLHSIGHAQVSSLNTSTDGIVSLDLAGCYTFMDNNFCETPSKGNVEGKSDSVAKETKKKVRSKKAKIEKATPITAASAPVMDRSGCLIEHLYFSYDEEWGLQVIIDWDKAKLEETKVDAMLIGSVIEEELVTLSAVDLQLHEDLYMRGIYRSDTPFEDGTVISEFIIQEYLYVLLRDKLLESEESCKTFVDRTMSEIYEQANSED